MTTDVKMEVTEFGYKKILGKPDYARFALSQVLVSVGDGFFGVLVTLLALTMGASATTLGIVAFCITFPRGILGIIGGAYADHYDRRRLMILCDAIRGTGVLVIATLLFMDALSILWLTIIGAAVTSTYAVSKPASKAFIPSIVDREELILANGFIQGMLWPSFFLGAGLVGILSALELPPDSALLSCALVFFCSQISLFSISGQGNKTKRVGTSLSVVHQLRVGMEELLIHRALMVRVSTYFLYTVSWRGTIQIALPLYVINVLHQPATFYSSLMVACGVGELVSSLIVGKLRISKTLKLSFFGELLLALALLMLAINYAGVVSSFIVALIACVLIGISATIIDIPLITAIQSDVDDSKSGKIFSYWSALGALGGSVGTLIVSGLISWLGLESTIMIMMVWLIISCLAAYLIAYGVKRSGR